MTNQTQNAVSTPAIKKFEVGKTYAAKKSVLFDSQINMTVIKRTKCYVSFQFDDEDDICRCKIVDEYGVEKICIHETNALDGDYEFSANDVADETATDEVKADTVNEKFSTVKAETEIARFEVGKRYRGKLDCGTKKIDCTIEVIKRTAKCIVYPTGGNTNPFCTKIKCSDTSEYISPASGLFVKASDVVIEPQPPTVDEPKIDSDASIVEVADTLNELDAAEYAITEEAFNVALDAEIELAAKTDEPETVKAETAEVKAEEVNDTVNEKFTTVKVENAEHAVEILGELNFRNVNFVYHGETNEHGAPVVYRHFDGINADGNGTCFGLIEIVINGKLDAVRFINSYRETAVDIKIGDASYTLGDKGEINLIDEPETVNSEIDSAEVAKFEVGKRYSGKAYKLERYRGKYRRSEPFDTTILVTKRTNSFVYAALAGNENYPAAYKIRTDATSEYIDYGHEHYFRADNVVSDIFNRESITVGTHAEALALIESTANDIFAFDFEQGGIENNSNFVQRNFKNVHRGAPEYKTFSFDEIFIDDRLNHVNFKNGNRSVRIFIATPDTPDKPTRKADTVTDEVNDTVTNDGNVGNLTDSALAASNSRLTAFNTPEENVEKFFDAYEAQNSVAHISENGYIAAVNFQPQNDVHWHCKIRRYENLDEAIDAVRYVSEHDTFTVTRGGRVETEYGKRNERTRDYFARNLYGVEYFKEAYFDELVDQYAVTVDAFNFAVEYEIEEAEYAAAESRAIARILANETLKIRYDKAKAQIKCKRYENGYCGWYFKGKHADKWEHDETKAAACLTRYGLSRFEFSVLSEDETAVINSNGYDESAFDLLPTVDELNDCRSDIEKEFDEFAAVDTDRDARFNHGERHAEKLTAKLREVDPTVEVTYDIDYEFDPDGEDVFYLRFGKYVYRSPFATLDAVEETFRLWREADEAATSEQVTADMLSKRDEIIKQRNNLDVIKRNGIITEAEYADKAAELDSELRYAEIQIDAVKAGDTFDYVEAAEHIKSVYEDLQLCVDLWTRIHGLTVDQCEKIYVAAHVDRNFTDEADRELASRMIDHFKRANDTTTVDSVNSEFDKAVAESVKNYSATIEINGETLTFEDGQLSEVGSTRYGAYFTIRNGRRIFYYRGNRVSKQDFFAHIETEDKAISERAAIAKFVAKYGGSEFKPGTNPQGNFVAQIHPTLANGRQDNYEVTFDTKDEAHVFIDEFKTLAGDMKFLATIKRGSFYGEVIYRHGLNGQEYFTTDTKESLREKKYALWDERRAIDGEIIGVKNAISEIKDGMRWLRDAGNCDAQIDELDYIIVKLEYRLGILTDKRNAIGAKIDDCNEKARIG